MRSKFQVGSPELIILVYPPKKRLCSICLTQRTFQYNEQYQAGFKSAYICLCHAVAISDLGMRASSRCRE